MQEYLSLIIPLAALITLITGLDVLVLWRRHEVRKHTPHVLLAIRAAKESERHPIVAEQFFAVLHGIRKNLSLLDTLLGRTQDTVSFELVHENGQIYCMVFTPASLKNRIESQLYAQYPDIEITERPDYLTTLPAAQHIDLALTDPDIFPIKRHTQFEDKIGQTVYDPLSGITSALSRVPDSAGIAAIQFLVQAEDEAWRSKAARCTRILGKGIFKNISTLQTWYANAFMTRSRWVKIVFFPFYLTMWFQGVMSGSATTLGGEKDGTVLSGESARTHEKEDSGKAAMDKAGKLPFCVNIRILYGVTQGTPSPLSTEKIQEIAASFNQFNQPYINSFGVRAGDLSQHAVALRLIEKPFVLSSEELATLWHLPNLTVKTPNIAYVTSRKLEPPIDLPDASREQNLTLLGSASYRGITKTFGIRQEDRRRHIYIIGKTGMGKSTLLENMILSDIQEGKGVAVVDPHGDLAEHILENIPSYRTNDVVVFDPSDRDFPVAFNMLENIDPAQNSVVASGLIGIFKKLYADSWGPRLEHILRNTVMALLEYQQATMLGIPRMLADDEFRSRVVKKLEDPVVKKFWTDEFGKMQEKQRTEAIAPIQNKVGQFLSSPIIRNIVGQPKSQVNLRYCMDNKKIFICNLSKGKIGEDSSSLLGSMIITKFQLDAMSRSNIPEKERVDFYLYVDEFQNFATDSFATILSEARKYRLNLTMANQYIAQMSEEVQGAVFGNVGTLLSFQVGYDDAEYMSKQFSEIILPNDLVQLPKYNLYAKLLADGMPTPPFSAATLPPISSEHDDERLMKVMRISRERYATPRDIVEDKIKRWSRSEDEKTPTKDHKDSKESSEKPASKNPPKPTPTEHATTPNTPAPRAPASTERPTPAPAPTPRAPVAVPTPASPQSTERAPTPKAPAPKAQPTQNAQPDTSQRAPQAQQPRPSTRPSQPAQPTTPKPATPAAPPVARTPQHSPQQATSPTSPAPQKQATHTPSAQRPLAPALRRTPEKNIASPQKNQVTPSASLPPEAASPAITDVPLPPTEEEQSRLIGKRIAASRAKKTTPPPVLTTAANTTPPRPASAPPRPATPLATPRAPRPTSAHPAPTSNTPAPQPATPTPAPQFPQPTPTPAPQPPFTPQPTPTAPAQPHIAPLTQAEYTRAVHYLAHYQQHYGLPRDQAWHAAVMAVVQQRGHA